MKIGRYEIGEYPAIIKKTYADDSFDYETSFTDSRDLYESMKAIRGCIGKTVGIATSDPKVLTGMSVIRGTDNIIQELSAGSATGQLFKCQTIKQRKIMEWLITQGITSGDIAEAKLSGPGMVRITNPAGQYMDLYCNAAYEVRILDVSEAREDELHSCFWNESNDPDTQEWRENLTSDEAAMVEQWDEQFMVGYRNLAQACLDAQNKTPVPSPELDYSQDM